jgi:putative phosphoesterase
MRILVVSDIHANWAALNAICQPFDLCVCLGDLVDYGPDPALCVRWAMKNAKYSIRGNHDHGVAQGVAVRGGTGYRYLTGVTRQTVWDSLGPDERRYLLQLPLTRRFTAGGKRFFLVHGTPRDPLDEYLLRDPETWAKRLENIDADIVCVGHTHMQFKLEIDGKIVLNPGSVGLPRDGDPRAAYALIDGDRIELRRLVYPVDETVARIKAMPWPREGKELMIQTLRLGRIPDSAVAPDKDSVGNSTADLLEL